jgi:spore coat polysaccharide biosynthesis predicted glycosyltransferase SpsG/CMP-N-acetylneuraminic acid synthetase
LEHDLTTRIIFVVPARAGDREVPYLNIKKLGALPLIAHTLEEARKSRYLDRLVVSTDDDKVKQVAEEFGAEVPFLRPPELASDDAELKAIVRHAVRFVEEKEGIRFDVVVTLQATSPFRTARQIDEAIERLLGDEFDSVISLKEMRLLTWRMEGGRLTKVFGRPGRRDEIEPLYQEDGAIRVLRRAVLDAEERLGARVGHIVMDKMSALTVHDIYDFWLAERLVHLPRVLFRVDGGGEMGMGHVYRSLAAAEALSKVSPTADICFLMRADRPEGVQHVSRSGYQVRVLPGADASAVPVQAIRDYSPNIVVNDLPYLDDSYLRSLATVGASTVNFVDTLSDIEKPTDMAAIIIAALAEEQVDLEDYHAGPAFTILRESFQKRSAEVSDRGRRVVLSFGGSDPQRLTLKALEALGPLHESVPGLEITAVLGPAFGHGRDLEELQKRLAYEPRVLRHVEHMADVLVEADVVLCSGGMTVFEIAALGRPGVVLCQNAREEARMQKFAGEGSILHLGLGTRVEEDVIRETTERLLNDSKARRRMSEAGARLVDAHGAARVAEVIDGARGRGPANGGRRE